MKRKLKIDLISLIVSFVIMIVAYFIKNETLEIILWATAFIIGSRAKVIEGVIKTKEEKSLNVEFLMIVSALAAFLIGNYQEGAILIFIFALSGVLEEYTMNKSSKALELLMNLVPKQANVLIDEKEVIVDINDLQINDLVIVKAGQQIPADGIIIKGTTIIDESMITGEYLPVEKDVSNKVLSGTINLQSTIIVKLTTQAKDSAMQRIVDFIKVAQNEETKTEVGINRFEKYFVYIVILASIIISIVPPLLSIWDFNTSLYKGIVLLVVASPCALVASISPVMLATMSRASKEGILLKGSTAIENLATTKTIFFDKTGTITKGSVKVVNIDIFVDDKESILKYLYLIEKNSNHPLANAITSHLETSTYAKDKYIETTEIKGRGIYANINEREVFVGKTDINDQRIENIQKEGYTTSQILIDQQLVGIISFSDVVRDNAVLTINELKNLNIKTIMLTGDNEYNAKIISESVGINNVVANCLPEDKVNIIMKEKTGATVAMVGDGINDAPSLAIADVGIAMKSGSDVALETADVVLMNNNILNVFKIIKLSLKAKRIYTQNIVFSILVIIVLVIMNVFGLVKLPMGVMFHEGSTILVILNSLRMLFKKFN